MSPSWKVKATAFGKASKKMLKDVKSEKQIPHHNSRKTTPSPYVHSVLQLYADLPYTPSRPSQDDRFVAQKLQRQRIPLRRVQAALLLGSARRLFPVDSSQPLLKIRSIRYFLPVVEELAFARVDSSYVDYLRRKLSEFLGRELSFRSICQGDGCDVGSDHRHAGRQARQMRLPW